MARKRYERELTDIGITFKADLKTVETQSDHRKEIIKSLASQEQVQRKLAADRKRENVKVERARQDAHVKDMLFRVFKEKSFDLALPVRRPQSSATTVKDSPDTTPLKRKFTELSVEERDFKSAQVKSP